MKLIYTLFLVLFYSSLALSQTKTLEDITLDMLRETQSTLDSTTSAEVLYNKGEISFSILNSWEYKFVVVKRIKIYTKEGYSQANVQLPYYIGERNPDKETLSNIKGIVYYENDGKIEKEILKESDIFDVDLSEFWKAKKFTLPKVQDGVIIQYSYSIDSPHIGNLSNWIFQNSIPTRYSEYKTSIPIDYLAYNVRTKGYYPFETIDKVKKGSLYVKYEGTNLDTPIRQITYVGTNLPKIENEPYANKISNYFPSVGYELSSYKNRVLEPFKVVSITWDDVVKTLSETDTYKKEISRTRYFKNDLNSILKNKTLPKDKMIAVFNFVKNKMTWNDEERRFTSKKLNKIYEEGVGNSADINVMLTAMLREANLDANPVLSSTISNGIPLFPTISGLNYVFTHVNIKGEIFLLDATDEFASPNILPSRALNWKGTLIKPNGFQALDIFPPTNSLKKYQVKAELNTQGEISGFCRIISLDQYGWESRRSLNNKSEDQKRLNYENYFGIDHISDIKTKNLNDALKPLIEEFNFSGKAKLIEKIGDKLYVSPMLFLKLKENPFKAETRIYPVDFTFPRNLEHVISLKIPEGYKVDYLPKKGILKLGDGVAKLTYLIEVYNNMILVKVNLEVNVALFLPQDYSLLREFYISLMNKENEKIVLVKS